MNKSWLLYCPTLLMCSISYAAPHDAFLMAKDFNTPPANLTLTASYDAVNDTIDIFDFRGKEGITDNSKGDYKGFSLAGAYNITPQWSVEGRYAHREIDYNPDKNKIESYLAAVSYSPNLKLNQNDALKLRASIWGDNSDVLSKTSPTYVMGTKFSQVRANNPEDIQLQLDAIFSRKLDAMNQLNAFMGLGYSKVSIDSLAIQASGQNIYIDKNNNVNLNGSSLAIDLTKLGLDMNKDLNYDSYYASIGGSWNFRYHKFESQLAYQYQHLWRKDIDDRISTFGNSPIKGNHTFGSKFSYDFTPHFTAFINAELYQKNFVGQIPFLYNGVTASRLNKRYGLASIGITYHGF